MIYPYLAVHIWRRTSSNKYGEPVFSRLGDEKCCVVRLEFKTETSTVRTDSAGTKGHAREVVADVILLFPPNSKLELEDKIIINGKAVRVVNRHPRYTVGGKLDHFQIECDSWGN